MIREVSSDSQTQNIGYMPLANLHSGHSRRLTENFVRAFGSVYTPPDYAIFLTSWAIRQSKDRVLDIGIGEGAFTFAAYHRLIKLGAMPTDAQSQLFGAEIDTATFNKFYEIARSINLNFSNLHNADFFDIDFPPVDAIVGNPPYVRRTYIENVDKIRLSVMERNLAISDLHMTRMTDLYIYFLLRALPMLKPGGRLAVITSDPWLNMSYGEEFKKYLQKHFKIETLITLDRCVFKDVQVKPVLILATKKEIIDTNWYVQFVRVKNELPIDKLQQSLSNHNEKSTDVAYTAVKGRDLKPSTPWSIHFKAPEIYEELKSHNLMTPMVNIAQTRIGLQTLAKEFFVLTPKRVRDIQLETEYLEPLAQSIRYFREPVINPGMEPPFYIFCCAKSKEELKDTHALDYILQGETTKVEVRGKGISVVGYHNKDRMKRSNRHYWYDLKSAFERRGSASILIPRLIYHTFNIIWNKAKFVPGELFIEFLPPPEIDSEVYLAILTSSISEIMLRIHAQVYGGGTYNIGPGQIRNVPILNAGLLTGLQREALKQSYLQYLSEKKRDRSVIDAVVCNILGYDDREQLKLGEILKDLLLLATPARSR